MTEFAIAGIQLDAAPSDNLALISKQVAICMARFPWVKMIILGELAANGTDPSRAEPLPGPSEDYFCSLAMKHSVWIVNGSVFELDDDKIYNTCSVINDQGEVVIRHRKLFPFTPYEKGITAGDQHTLFDVPGIGRFGVSICYDMWFQETTRALATQGAEVILHPTMTNTIDRDLETCISRASAATNQCYFIDINSGGDLGWGQSVIIGPEGEVIHKSGRHGEIIPVVLDLGKVRRTREKGVFNLGQPLKSFRDTKLKFPQYDAAPAYLASLGVLKVPE